MKVVIENSYKFQPIKKYLSIMAALLPKEKLTAFRSFDNLIEWRTFDSESNCSELLQPRWDGRCPKTLLENIRMLCFQKQLCSDFVKAVTKIGYYWWITNGMGNNDSAARLVILIAFSVGTYHHSLKVGAVADLELSHGGTLEIFLKIFSQ